jgi:hypothetical protein
LPKLNYKLPDFSKGGDESENQSVKILKRHMFRNVDVSEDEAVAFTIPYDTIRTIVEEHESAQKDSDLTLKRKRSDGDIFSGLWDEVSKKMREH